MGVTRGKFLLVAMLCLTGVLAGLVAGPTVGQALGKSAADASKAVSYFHGPALGLLSLSETEDGLLVRWYFGVKGDYDLSGTIDIADLTPLAQNFGRQVGSDRYLMFVDSHPFGEIGVSEITPIAENFGLTFCGSGIMLGESREGPWRTVRIEPMHNYIGFDEYGRLLYEAVVSMRSTDTHIWVKAILDPIPWWYEEESPYNML